MGTIARGCSLVQPLLGLPLTSGRCSRRGSPETSKRWLPSFHHASKNDWRRSLKGGPGTRSRACPVDRQATARLASLRPDRLFPCDGSATLVSWVRRKRREKDERSGHTGKASQRRPLATEKLQIWSFGRGRP